MKLEPCPFCSGGVHIVKLNIKHSQYTILHSGSKYRAECKVRMSDHTEEGLIKSWNNRKVKDI